ncbi:MAG: DUF4214 domain-containing protein [Nevskiales bacterium]
MPEITATPDDVRAAYRLVLGRDPDPEGFADYLALLQKTPLTTRQLFARFLISPEFLTALADFFAKSGDVSG